MSFTPDGKEIVSAERYSDRAGGRLQQYQVRENPNQIPRLLQDTIDSINGAVVSKDGRWIVSIVKTKVIVRNTRTNEVVEVGEHGLGVRAIDVSPDSTRFASGSEDKAARIFSITTGQRLLGPLQHDNTVFAVMFSPNGTRLASFTFSGIVHVWDACTGSNLMQTPVLSAYRPTVNPTHYFTPLGWFNDSRRLFVVPESSRQIINADISRSDDMPPWYSKLVPGSNNSAFCSLATKGKFIVCAAGASLSFWDTSSCAQIGSTIEFQDSILSIALSSDGSYLACGRGDKKITVYALRDLLPLNTMLDVSVDLLHSSSVI